MHEHSVCRSLLEQVLATGARANAVAVRAIRVELGVLSGYDAAHLREALAEVAAGTVAEGARVEVVPVPLRVHCPDCGSIATVDPDCLDCPACGDPGTVLVDGTELRLVDVVLTLPAGAAPVVAP